MSASVAGRMAWSMLAIAPGTLVLALTEAGWRSLGAAAFLSVLLAMLAPVVLQGRSWGTWRADPGALQAGLLAWSWVSCVDPTSPLAAVSAALVAVALQQAFGGSGQAPFHPAAAAVATVLLLAPAAGPAAEAIPAAIAFAAGGLAMLARGLSPPSAVLGWFAGLGIGCLLAGRAGAAAETEALAPVYLLVGGFVFADGGSSGMRSAPRAVCGITAGLLASTLPGPAALPCAVLLANLFVPVVERALPPRVRG